MHVHFACRPLLAVVAAVGIAGRAGAALAPDELFRTLSPSVWRVATTDAAGRPIASGSAVVIGAGLLVTNCHVLKGASAVAVRQGAQSVAARLAHADPERDLCELAAPDLKSTPVPIATEQPQVGQRIYTIGSPRGLDATLSDGLVSGLRRDAAGNLVYIQISAPISPGSSGGGLFDVDGRLLGITSAGVAGEAQNLNFARPAAQIPEIPARAAAALQRWRGAGAVAALPGPQAVAPPSPASQPGPQGTSRPPEPPTAPVLVPGPAQPARIASGYAAVDDIDAIPYLTEHGRRDYQAWLKLPLPRAFAISPTGHYWHTSTTHPKDQSLPVDPSERALLMCERNAHRACKLYAVNNAVVWTREPSPSGAQLQAVPVAGSTP